VQTYNMIVVLPGETTKSFGAIQLREKDVATICNISAQRINGFRKSDGKMKIKPGHWEWAFAELHMNRVLFPWDMLGYLGGPFGALLVHRTYS